MITREQFLNLKVGDRIILPDGREIDVVHNILNDERDVPGEREICLLFSPHDNLAVFGWDDATNTMLDDEWGADIELNDPRTSIRSS